MRVLVAVVVIVLVGIADDSIADEDSRKVRNNDVDIDLDRSLASECAKNGGPDAASVVEAKVEAALGQLFIDLDINGTFRSASVQAGVDQNLLPILTYLCSRRQHIEKFSVSAGEAVKTCFDANTREHLDILHDLSNNLTRFICDRNIEEFSNFVTNDGLICFVRRQKHILNCVTDLMPDSSEESSSTTTTINSDKDDKDCNEGIDFRKCMNIETKTCVNCANEEFVARFINFFVQPICENSELYKKMVALAVASSETSNVGE